MRPLSPGSTVAIISPARHAPQEKIDKGVKGLEALGYKVKVHPQNYSKHHQLAGSDKERANALMEMFLDPVIDAILCARGGIGSYRTLPHLDFELIKKHPKIFCGFSDITTLLTAITTQCGFPTFHGPMCWNFPAKGSDYLDNFSRMMSGQMGNARQTYHQGICVREGGAEGELIGGNLCLLQNLMETKYEASFDDKILFIEDTEERWSAFDRMLHHFAMAGKFKNIHALIVGELVDMREDEAGPWEENLADTLKKLVPPGIPIVLNFPCGHGDSLMTFPLGTKTRLEVTANASVLQFLQNPFA